MPFDANNLQGYATKTLTASESVNIVEDLIGDDANLAGAKLTAYVGYWVGDDIATLTYTQDPVVASIAKKPTAGCPTNTAATGTTFSGKPVCELTGRIETNTHLTSNNAYQLSSAVFIGTNTDTDNDKKISLTIDAGTKIFSPVGFNALIIDKSAKIPRLKMLLAMQELVPSEESGVVWLSMVLLNLTLAADMHRERATLDSMEEEPPSTTLIVAVISTTHR